MTKGTFSPENMQDTMGTDVHRKVSSVNRAESPSITDIIEKFQKIKEERFKPKDTPQRKSSFTLDRRFTRHGEPVISLRTFEKPETATQKIRDFIYKNSQEPRRRHSLPSIRKPETPPPLIEDWIDESAKKRLQERSRVIKRRYSTSHASHDFAKMDLKQWFREGRKLSLEERKLTPIVAKPAEDEDEYWKGWLKGEDLHEYYNLWESRKGGKPGPPKRLSPLGSDVSGRTKPNVGEDWKREF